MSNIYFYIWYKMTQFILEASKNYTSISDILFNVALQGYPKIIQSDNPLSVSPSLLEEIKRAVKF